jgi:hypothetical protein
MRKITNNFSRRGIPAQHDGRSECPDAGRLEPERASTECYYHSQGGLRRRLGPLVSAGPAPRVQRLGSLLVRALLVNGTAR